ncbi:MAG: hypothetical protein LE179_00975 [Endomicrobium sp.]|jgi:hypothetical protein|nr:hypothetical protein [Endomicrobium sp.]
MNKRNNYNHRKREKDERYAAGVMPKRKKGNEILFNRDAIVISFLLLYCHKI